MNKDFNHKDRKIYYVHGYLSDPNSTKGSLFKKELNAKAIKYRDCEPEDLIISDALQRIKKIIDKDNEIVLIGSSLGGLLAAKSANNKQVTTLILLNPAIIPPSVDIKEIEGMPQRILIDMLDPKLFNSRIDANIYIIIGTNDEVVPNDWSIEFAKNQEATIKFLIDDHRFSNKLNILPKLIKSYLDKKH